jgi:hypothetical protein
MIVMLARPMVTFLLVLGAIDEPDVLPEGSAAR